MGCNSHAAAPVDLVLFGLCPFCCMSSPLDHKGIDIQRHRSDLTAGFWLAVFRKGLVCA